MAPPGGMTFEEMRGEMNVQRFGPNMQASTMHWVNLREGVIWNDSEWPFKRVRREAVTATDGLLIPPEAFWKAVSLELPDGTTLNYLNPDEFNRVYEVDDTSQGTAVDYSALNSAIQIGSSYSGTVHLSYDRRVCHLNSIGGVTVGPMIEDDDYPIYPVEYHYMLVVGAMASGLKIQNDPTWDALEQEFQQMLVSMREDLLPPDQYSNAQFGRDTLA